MDKIYKICDINVIMVLYNYCDIVVKIIKIELKQYCRKLFRREGMQD